MIYLLHISDLHLVTDPQWNNMKNAILFSVREKLRHISRGQKLLVITGDFHNFVENNYIQAEQFLPQLFEAMGIEPDKDVFVIPGNHDISIPDSEKGERSITLQAINSDPKLLQTGINKLLSYYGNYTEFVQKLNIYPADCGKLPAHVHVRTWRNKLHLLHLNTTLIAGGGVKNGQMTDTLTATSDQIRNQLRSNNLPCIAIGHNSYFDLLHNQRIELSAMFLQENISAYLCGDRHQRNCEKEENRITLSNRISSVTIPNIVSYRSSSDENDTYSDFGMIWQLWDENTGRVNLEYMKWDPQDQAELQPDGNDLYNFREPYQPISSASTTNRDDNCWLSNDTISKQGKIAFKKYHVRNFLRGGRCKWNLAFSDKIVSRDVVDELYQYVTDGGIYALVGPGGEGKTTILRQLCVKLISDGIPVFYYRGYGTLQLPINIPDQAVFVLDNPPNTIKFKHFMDVIIENGQTLVLGARQNEWNLLKSLHNISDRDVLELPLQTLTIKESWRFADCISNHLNCSISKREIKDIFHDNSYGFLYAAMLMVVNNSHSLEEIAKQIISNLYEQSHTAMLLLAHIVLSEQYEVKFIYAQFKPICNKLHISPRDANKALSREISLNGDIYQTRHDIISKLFYNELFSDDGLLLLDEIDEILENLILFYLERYRTCYTKNKTINWNSILKLSGSLSQASSETQKYLINRILDEVKSEWPKTFYQLPAYINNEEVELLFYRQCFERENISLDFLLKWCKILKKNGLPWTIDEPYSPAWIMRTACLNHNADSNVWLAWARMEAAQNQAGDYDSEHTARWIFRQACLLHNANSDVWMAWAQFEAGQNQAGDYDSEHTARWIFRQVCLLHNANSNTWLAWAQFEAEQNQAGDYDSEYTARWIFRQACLFHNANSNTWRSWAQLEARQNQIGDYDSEYTARWIFHEACLNHNADSSTWLAWAQFEATQNQVGDYDSAYTARWIFHEACLNHNTDSNTWLAWAQFEAAQSQAGDYDSEYTARWIFHEACLFHNASGDTWLAWAQFEASQNQVGDYDSEYTARWIFRQACLFHNANSNTWRAWAQLEAGQNQAGDYDSEYTARWIFHEACLIHNADSNTWLAWAQFEAAQNQVGDYDSEYTARWIFRQACLIHNMDSSTWLAWAQFEAGQKQVGAYGCENTARWIFSEAIKRFPKDFRLYSLFAYMELSMHSTENARKILRQSVQYSEHFIGRLAILEFFCGNIDSEDLFCTNNLMTRMEKETTYSFSALLYLYHCCVLLERTTEADRYYKMLLQNPKYDPSNTSVTTYIELCKEAFT